jgi:predicted nucleic acid-binding protein
VLTQKVQRPVSKDRAGNIVKSFVDSPAWGKVSYNCDTASRATEDSATMHNHFWDLLVAETMRDGGLKRIYTENVKDFEGIPWVHAVNPLAAPEEAGGARHPITRRATGRRVPKSINGNPSEHSSTADESR